MVLIFSEFLESLGRVRKFSLTTTCIAELYTAFYLETKSFPASFKFLTASNSPPIVEIILPLSPFKSWKEPIKSSTTCLIPSKSMSVY